MEKALKLLAHYYGGEENVPAVVDSYQFPGMVVVAFLTSLRTLCLKYFKQQHLVAWLREAEDFQSKMRLHPAKKDFSLENAFAEVSNRILAQDDI
jgi:hypothetical protein